MPANRKFSWSKNAQAAKLLTLLWLAPKRYSPIQNYDRQRREQEVTNGTHPVCLGCICTICKKRRESKHLKESLAVFGTHFPDEKGEPVKSSTISDVLKEAIEHQHEDQKEQNDFTKWFTVTASGSSHTALQLHSHGEASNSTK